MSGFDHGANQGESAADRVGSARRTRLGLILFAIYLVLYGGFVFLNAFVPQAMEATPLLGLNLAIVYGMSLILSAFGLALLYGWLCREG